MKHLTKNNKGVTLIELISAIAILSIVAISAFTLLMFSIRSHNFIISGSSAAQDADLLNKRLELLFADSATVSVNETGDVLDVSVTDTTVTEGKTTSTTSTTTLSFRDGKLVYGSEVWQENLSGFKAEKVGDTYLLKVSYTIGNRNFVKLFRVNFAT